MAALSANVRREFSLGQPPRYASYPVADNVTIYAGSLVGDNGSGYARPLVAGDPFLGISEQNIDTTTPASLSAGDKEVRVRRKGGVKATVTGITALTDVGAEVYGASDNDFTLVATSNSALGRVGEIVVLADDEVYVEFEAANLRSI